MKLVPGTLSISSSPHAYCGNNTRRKAFNFITACH